ncbi:MAG TPA: YidB family protein [Microvirga sp.]|nr:YidB family protein [Microvirga sp.]
MSRGFPSMTALLGLLAIAGYQNRDKLSEMIGGLGGGASGAPGGAGSTGGAGGLGGLGGLLGGLGGAGAGGLLSGGLGELMDRFKQNGHGDTAESWVGTGPNKEVAPHQLEQAIGPDVLENLTKQTGLSREELLSRLSRELPQAVDKYTPEGRLPTHG